MFRGAMHRSTSACKRPVAGHVVRHMNRLPLRLVALAMAGCGAAGAFGQATMFKECNPGDSTCRRAAPAAPIAVGARLRPDVRIDVRGSVMPVVALSSSREDVVAVEDG